MTTDTISSDRLYWQSTSGGGNTGLLTEIAQDPSVPISDKLEAVRPHIVGVSVPEYLEDLREQYHRTYTQIADGCMDMDRGYIIDIFKGRRFTTRDNFIKILYFGIGASLDQTRRFCRFAQVGDLDPSVHRDRLMIMCMTTPSEETDLQPGNKRMSLIDTNLTLYKRGFDPLGQSFTDIEKCLGYEKNSWPVQDTVPTMPIESYTEQGAEYLEVLRWIDKTMATAGAQSMETHHHREVTPGRYLQWMLEQKGMTVKELAEKANVKYDSMKQYVNGLRKKPRDRNVALRIVFALDMTVRQAQSFLNIVQCGKLWPKAAMGRDMLLMHAIATKMSLAAANELLQQEGMDPLLPPDRTDKQEWRPS